MDKFELFEAFDLKHQGSYTLEALAALVIDAFDLGAESEQATIQQVRDLHKPNENDECSICAYAVNFMGGLDYEPYPCPTIRYLDGEQE